MTSFSNVSKSFGTIILTKFHPNKFGSHTFNRHGAGAHLFRKIVNFMASGAMEASVVCSSAAIVLAV